MIQCCYCQEQFSSVRYVIFHCIDIHPKNNICYNFSSLRYVPEERDWKICKKRRDFQIVGEHYQSCKLDIGFDKDCNLTTKKETGEYPSANLIDETVLSKLHSYIRPVVQYVKLLLVVTGWVISLDF